MDELGMTLTNFTIKMFLNNRVLQNLIVSFRIHPGSYYTLRLLLCYTVYRSLTVSRYAAIARFLMKEDSADLY